MDYRIYASTEKAKDPTHRVNEDSYMFSEFSFMKDKKIKVMLVADGMGGLARGEQASKDAIEGFMGSFYGFLMARYLNTEMEAYSLTYEVKEIQAAMVKAMQQANAAVCANCDPYEPTGTTLSAVCVIDDCMVAVNVGDSPIYLYRRSDRRLRMVSMLQTKAEQDVLAGAYARYSKPYYQQSHILYCSLGQYTKLREEDMYATAIGQIRPGDVILMGSDGCFGYMQEEILQDLIGDCHEEEEGFVLSQLFAMSRLDKDDDQTALMYVSA